MENFKPTDPECESIETMVQYLLDNEETSFDHRHLTALRIRLQMSAGKVRAELEKYGLTMKARKSGRKVRTFGSNPHDRWSAYPSHGGSGGDQIRGVAGRPG